MRIGLAFFSADPDTKHSFSLCLAASEWADQNGLSSVWVPERHYHAFGGAFPEPAVAAAAIAACTKRIQIRAGSVVVTLHNAIEVVERWAMVDCLSAGRVGLALASGWREEDFLLRPDAFAPRHDAIWRQIEEARRLWRGESLEVKRGEVSTSVRTYPRPVQTELPLWIAIARGGPGVRRAADEGVGIFTHLVSQSVAELESLIVGYRARCPNGHVVVMLHTFVGETDRIAQQTAREPLLRYLEQWRDLSVGTGPAKLGPEQERLLRQVAVERYFRGRSLIGSVQTCRNLLSHLASISVDEVACLIDFGIADQKVKEGLVLLKELVD